jgi:hypothetical protein
VLTSCRRRASSPARAAEAEGREGTHAAAAGGDAHTVVGGGGGGGGAGARGAAAGAAGADHPPRRNATRSFACAGAAVPVGTTPPIGPMAITQHSERFERPRVCRLPGGRAAFSSLHPRK